MSELERSFMTHAADQTAGRGKRPTRFRRAGGLRGFFSDRRGVAAVEFGLIAPVLALMLLGAIEITRAVAIDRRVTIATSMIADLVTREETLTKTDVEAIYAIVGEAMNPFDPTVLKMSVVPIVSSADDATKARVYADIDPDTGNPPGYNGGTVEKTKCNDFAELPEGLLEKNESLIAVRTSYTYTPLFIGVLGSSIWEKTAYAKPRKAQCVEFVGADRKPNAKVCGGCF